MRKTREAGLPAQVLRPPAGLQCSEPWNHLAPRRDFICAPKRDLLEGELPPFLYTQRKIISLFLIYGASDNLCRKNSDRLLGCLLGEYWGGGWAGTLHHKVSNEKPESDPEHLVGTFRKKMNENEYKKPNGRHSRSSIRFLLLMEEMFI